VDVYAMAGIRLLVLTGMRLAEVLTCRWPYVDLKVRVIRLPDSKRAYDVDRFSLALRGEPRPRN
jgi:integrase